MTVRSAHPTPVALITGAARGIGLATARRFLEDGWRVALLDIDGPAQEAAAEALGRPEDTLALTTDVAIEAEVQAALDRVAERFGRLRGGRRISDHRLRWIA